MASENSMNQTTNINTNANNDIGQHKNPFFLVITKPKLGFLSSNRIQMGFVSFSHLSPPPVILIIVDKNSILK
uniref:Uncharacterized protein n=1 Tax=Rhizophora mucronata TaxID=61149 RepID=A0A2P2NMK2_RHIMU